MQKPILIRSLSVSFTSGGGFHDFSQEIVPFSRIGIIGPNGVGKSTLLKLLLGHPMPHGGTIHLPTGVVIGYVPQYTKTSDPLSGAQYFHQALTRALSDSPNVLLLDEPSNHLDAKNRQSIIRLIKKFSGTVIVVSHDPSLLRQTVDTLWHIEHNRITVFSGHFDDYLEEIKLKRQSLEHQLAILEKEEKGMHLSLMQEQKRAASSKKKGIKSIRQRKWPTIVSTAKMQKAQTTTGRKKYLIEKRKSAISQAISEIILPEVITPIFSLPVGRVYSKALVSVRDASIGYQKGQYIQEALSFSLSFGDKIAVTGVNGSGKTTLLKALRGDPSIVIKGEWTLLKQHEVGYLDQHYDHLPLKRSVLEALEERVPDWSQTRLRRHLSEFLFQKEIVFQTIGTLSEGEKARLSLALIAAKTPALLILDEVTNNLDWITKEHVTSILSAYPGALIIVSHDEEFIAKLNVKHTLDLGSIVTKKR